MFGTKLLVACDDGVVLVSAPCVAAAVALLGRASEAAGVASTSTLVRTCVKNSVPGTSEVLPPCCRLIGDYPSDIAEELKGHDIVAYADAWAFVPEEVHRAYIIARNKARQAKRKAQEKVDQEATVAAASKKARVGE
jgi:hypothetical protein